MFRPSTSRGSAGIGQRRQPQSGHRFHALNRFEHRGGANRTVDAQNGCPASFEFRSKLLRRRAVQRVAIFLGPHLRDDRQVRHRTHGVDGGADFVQIAEGLEDEQIDAALE